MGFTFENQGSGSYLVYKLSGNEELDSMSLGMLNNNRIPGLIPPLFTRMDLNEYIKYNVSSKISVKQFFTGTVNKKQIVGVFRGIAETMISAEEYMIDPANIILNTEYIFSDVSTCETVLVCLPVKGAVQRVDLKSFLRDIMFNTQFDQTENCDHVAQIINFLNIPAVFSVYDFKKLLDKIASSSSAPDAAEVRASVPQIQQPQNPAPFTSDIRNSESRNQAAPAMAPSAPSLSPSPSPLPTPNSAHSPNTPASKPVYGTGSKVISAPKQADSGMAFPAADRMPSKMAAPGMKAPNAPAVNGVASAPAVRQEEGEKISLMYLLQHYNKENAEKYKAQKQAKKASKSAAAPTALNVPDTPDFKAASPSVRGNGMAFPGQNAAAPPLAVPMNAPKPANAVNVNAPAQAPQPVHAAAPASPSHNEAPVNQGGYADFGETQYIQQYDDDSATAFLMPGAQNNIVQPYLQSKRNNERIPVEGNIFRLGRDKDFNDYVIQNNKFVGHSHCHILVENGEYFIVDDNSKNRTYVEGTPIQPGVKIKLVHGQSIKLADEEFEFRLF